MILSKINPETGKPINWQKPKKNHPWRQYANKRVAKEEEEINIISVREYLTELLENWEKIEVTSIGSKGDRTYPLTGLSQRKVAAYISGVLRRNYVK